MVQVTWDDWTKEVLDDAIISGITRDDEKWQIRWWPILWRGTMAKWIIKWWLNKMKKIWKSAWMQDFSKSMQEWVAKKQEVMDYWIETFNKPWLRNKAVWAFTTWWASLWIAAQPFVTWAEKLAWKWVDVIKWAYDKIPEWSMAKQFLQGYGNLWKMAYKQAEPTIAKVVQTWDEAMKNLEMKNPDLYNALKAWIYSLDAVWVWEVAVAWKALAKSGWRQVGDLLSKAEPMISEAVTAWRTVADASIEFAKNNPVSSSVKNVWGKIKDTKNEVAEWLISPNLKNPAMREKYIAKVWQTPEKTLLDEWVKWSLQDQASYILNKASESAQQARKEAKKITSTVYSKEWEWIAEKIVEGIDESIPWIKQKVQPIIDMWERFRRWEGTAEDLIMAKTYMSRYEDIYDDFGRVKKTWDTFEKEALADMYTTMKNQLEELWEQYWIDFKKINHNTMKYEWLRWIMTRAVQREAGRDIFSLTDYIMWWAWLSADPLLWTTALLWKKIISTPPVTSRIANALYTKTDDAIHNNIRGNTNNILGNKNVSKQVKWLPYNPEAITFWVPKAKIGISWLRKSKDITELWQENVRKPINSKKIEAEKAQLWRVKELEKKKQVELKKQSEKVKGHKETPKKWILDNFSTPAKSEDVTLLEKLVTRWTAWAWVIAKRVGKSVDEVKEAVEDITEIAFWEANDFTDIIYYNQEDIADFIDYSKVEKFMEDWVISKAEAEEFVASIQENLWIKTSELEWLEWDELLDLVREKASGKRSGIAWDMKPTEENVTRFALKNADAIISEYKNILKKKWLPQTYLNPDDMRPAFNKIRGKELLATENHEWVSAVAKVLFERIKGNSVWGRALIIAWGPWSWKWSVLKIPNIKVDEYKVIVDKVWPLKEAISLTDKMWVDWVFVNAKVNEALERALWRTISGNKRWLEEWKELWEGRVVSFKQTVKWHEKARETTKQAFNIQNMAEHELYEKIRVMIADNTGSIGSMKILEKWEWWWARPLRWEDLVKELEKIDIDMKSASIEEVSKKAKKALDDWLITPEQYKAMLSSMLPIMIIGWSAMYLKS